ncbi:EboA domain-containing protein [Chromobacterium sp. IIBBL 290-4]|uniref:EboA domain-containing protein n=1 Tax=Chromobacterium sp. IIBBL 290-4 TaxID=2953890 RepID=UPI0020B7DD94|nr:EboA domain-containing protein [Chromobacterium sp. IIBBL 290-4]UTH74061.1 EboA domain-containing protein [Chromobacterium sp. IIBBL 290-4]
MRVLDELLYRELRERASPAGLAWLERSTESSMRQDDGNFLRLYASAARKLSNRPLQEPELNALSRAGVTDASAWHAAVIGRLLLLRAVLLDRAQASAHKLVFELYRQGDAGEQQSLLRSLPLLPMPEIHLDTAIGACRSHIQGNFEAIACDNAYPARFFPELNFNQMAIKALFTGAPLAKVQGLAQRLTPELIRMAEDFLSERQATGYAIPADIQLILKGSRHENV